MPAGDTRNDNPSGLQDVSALTNRQKPPPRPAQAPLDKVLESARVSRARAPGSAAAGILGEIAWLMTLSPFHKHLFVGDLEWLVVPAVTLKQFRLYRTGKTPWAYASWALLTEEAERRLADGQRRLQPAEWRAGDRPWLIDVICPFGGPEAVLKDIRDNVFPDKSVKALVPAPGGKELRVMVLKGKDAEGNK